jgi:DNA-directed RNA polymerase alpha subunit
LAKKVYSFSLSEEAYDVITTTEKERNYNSTSAALEAILLNRDITDARLKKLMLEVLRDNQVTVTQDVKEVPPEPNKEIENILEKSMEDMFNKMK